MRYKFMYYQMKKGKKIMTVLDYHEARFMHFDLEYLQSKEADENLKAYMRTIWRSRVENSQFEYKEKK